MNSSAEFFLDKKDFVENRQPATYEQIHKSLASGFLRNIAVKKQPKIYQGASNRELMIFPGSHQFLTAGQWIIAASFLETTRLFALTVASIEPDWLEQLGSHLVKYSWSNPRWQKKTGQVIADEKVSLFGLILVAGRTVNFPKRSPKNVSEAREIFIQAALIEGNLNGQYSFLDHNENLIEKWRKAEDKLRTTAIVQDDSNLVSFYANRLPTDVFDKSTLNKCLKRRGQNFLRMTDEDIVKNLPDKHTLANFPQTLHVGTLELQLDYTFAPGTDADGVTVRIPLSVAPSIKASIFEWLVPGLLKEKILFLLKGLPKSLRRHLVPVNLTVDRVMDDLSLYKGSLYGALESSIHKMFRIAIQRSDWPTALPTHLKARYLLFDLNGTEVATGREYSRLLKQEIFTHQPTTIIASNLESSYKDIVTKWENFSTRTWDFTDLPENIPLITPQQEIAGFLYPVIVGQQERGGVGVSFERDQQKASSLNSSGVAHLFKLQFSDGYKSLKKHCESMITGPSARFLLDTGAGKKSTIEQILLFIMRGLFSSINGNIPSEALFYEQVSAVKRNGFYKEGCRIAEEAFMVLKKRREVQEKLNHFLKIDKRKLIFTTERSEAFLEQLLEIVPADFFQHIATMILISLCVNCNVWQSGSNVFMQIQQKTLRS